MWFFRGDVSSNSVVQQSNVLFQCLDLNGFKEAISQQESEEENGCGLTMFGVTYLSLFVSLSVEVVCWSVVKLLIEK